MNSSIATAPSLVVLPALSQTKVTPGESQAVVTGRPLKGPVFDADKIAVSRVDVSDLLDTSRVIEVEQVEAPSFAQNAAYFFFKRAIDIVVSLLVLLVAAIPMCVIALLVKRCSPGPVFYRQERLGRDGEPFMLVKFRTMYEDAEAKGAQWAAENDPRVTPIGRVLRKSRLDELPQLFQVLTGKLSLIGPRPERKVFYDEFEKHIHGFSQRLAVKPGLSGLAQVSGGYDLKPAEKIVYDIEYIKGCSLLMDMKIMLQTVAIVFTHEGAR